MLSVRKSEDKSVHHSFLFISAFPPPSILHIPSSMADYFSLSPLLLWSKAVNSGYFIVTVDVLSVVSGFQENRTDEQSTGISTDQIDH